MIRFLHVREYADWLGLAVVTFAIGAFISYSLFKPQGAAVRIGSLSMLAPLQRGHPPKLRAHDVEVVRECSASVTLKITTPGGRLLYIDTVVAGHTLKGTYEHVDFSAKFEPLPNDVPLTDGATVWYDRIDLCHDGSIQHPIRTIRDVRVVP